jgi:hypothetical protein
MEKINSWKDCIISENAKKIIPNPERIKGMYKILKRKLKFAKSMPIEKENAMFIFTEFYDCARHLCEIIAYKSGFKIYNHKCLTRFLIDILKETRIGKSFDTCRKLRNNINYYGKAISYEESLQRIKECKEIINKLEGHL